MLYSDQLRVKVPFEISPTHSHTHTLTHTYIWYFLSLCCVRICALNAMLEFPHLQLSAQKPAVDNI